MGKSFVALLLLASILFFTACGQGEAGGNASSAASIAGAYWQGAQVQPVPLGETVFTFTVELDGLVVSLPGSPVQLLQNGWQNAGFEKVVLQPGEQLETVFEKEGIALTALVANHGETKQDAYKCQLTGLVLAQGKWRLPQGLAPGSSKEEIEKVCGLPKTGEKEGLLAYSIGRNTKLEFWLDGQQKLERVKIENHTQWGGQRILQDALPPVVKAYTPPAELGESWAAGVVEYGEKLYKIPAPVDAFLEDGWLLLDDGQEMVAPGGWLMGVRLAKGNQILRTCVWNYSEEAQPIAACFVSTVYSGKGGPAVNLLLPGQLGLGSSWEDVLALYGEPSITYTNIQARYYTFGTAGQGVQFQLAKEEDRIEGITLRFDAL